MNDALHTLALQASGLLRDAPTLVLLTLLIAAAASDCRRYRIPNWLTGGGAVAGLVLVSAGSATPLQAFLLALAGAAVGLFALLPLYMVRMLGAGDVKLMAMAGAFLGPWGTLYAIVFVLVTGGLVAIGYAAWHRVSGQMFRNVRDMVVSLSMAAMAGTPPLRTGSSASAGRIPYGLSICLGTTTYVVLRQAGLV